MYASIRQDEDAVSEIREDVGASRALRNQPSRGKANLRQRRPAVTTVDDKVRVDRPGQQAMKEWLTSPPTGAGSQARR
jgi:hypothetical protein